MNYISRIENLIPYSQEIRRDLHRHPELGFQEFRTATVISRELSSMDMEITTGIAETGVVALLDGFHSGPVLLLRFDMDALPIQEQTGVEYCSQNHGVMHACGHDSHVAIGLTVAKVLYENRDKIHGSVKFVFQPAEEGLGGAERMLDAGIMENPKVDFTLSMHVWNEKPLGWVGIVPGPLMAGADIFEVQIDGKGGHGALPQETVDPVVATAQIITAIQSIMSRNISPQDSAVISVCQIKAGETFNVIPQSTFFCGTFRTFEREVRDIVINKFEQIVNGIANAMDCQAKIKIKKMTSAIVNDKKLTAIVREAVAETFPEMTVEEKYLSMVSEDMSFIMEKAPGCYILVGSGFDDPIKNFGHHHPKFNINENVLPAATKIITASVLRILSKM